MKKYGNRKLFVLCLSSVAVFSLYCLADFLRGAKFFFSALAIFLLGFFLSVAKGDKNTKKNIIFSLVLAVTVIFSSCFAFFAVKKNEAPFCYSDGKEHFSRAVIDRKSVV